MTTALYGPDFFAGRSETVTLSASVVVPILKELLAPRSLLDVGCGRREWLDAFGLDDAVGVDIFALEGEDIVQHDLTAPLDLGRLFDLVISLEVGEHLPEQAADTYIASLTRHGPRVAFSAAVPGQEGKGHINCQPHEYWREKFAERRFEMLDVIRPRIQDHRVSPWYRNNLFLYEAC